MSEETFWDAKAYSTPAFDDVLSALTRQYEQAAAAVRKDLHIVVALSIDVDRIGPQGDPNETNLPIVKRKALEALPDFQQWFSALPDDRGERSFQIPRMGAALPLVTITVSRVASGLSFGAQDDAEVAYQLRRKLAQEAHQLDRVKPNVRVVVQDPFGPYSVYLRPVWMAALGYFNRKANTEGRAAQFTEGVLNLTSDVTFGDLPGARLSQLLHAVVYFDPQVAFRASSPLLFPLDENHEGAVMFVRADRRQGSLIQLGERLGCSVRAESIAETEGFIQS